MDEENKQTDSAGEPPPPPPDDVLQFDEAEFATPTQAQECSGCKRQITSEYYAVNGQIMCPECRAGVVAAFSGGRKSGRVLKALIFGGITALVCSITWYAIVKLTGYHIGLVAIVIGWAVGAAVRRGSAYRGGWLYQAMAVILTYLAIVGSYIPVVVRQLSKEDLKRISTTEARKHADRESGSDDSNSSAPAEIIADAEDAGTSSAISQKDKSREKAVGPGVFAAVVLVIAFIYPFLGGFQNIIGILIILFGLYQAWKMNKRIQVSVTGPYHLGSPRPSAP